MTLYCLCSAMAPSAIYTLSLHDALPILISVDDAARHVDACRRALARVDDPPARRFGSARTIVLALPKRRAGDRKSTRLNSSHVATSYAVFCLQKKTTTHHKPPAPVTTQL